MIKAIFKLEWTVFSRSQGQWLYPVMFLIMVLTLFVMGVEPTTRFLQTMAPAIIWCAYILSMLLALDHLWRDDYKSGVLEQLILNNKQPMLYLFLRCLVRWLYCLIPLLVALPFTLLLLKVPMSILFVVAASLIVGSLSFWLMGSSLSALTLNNSRSSLMSLLLLPLSVPLVIFGSRLIKFAIAGEELTGALLMLTGVMILCLSLTPWLIYSAIKLNLD